MNTAVPAPAPANVAAADSVRDARRGLGLFFALLMPLSCLGYWFYIARNIHLVLPFTPLVAAVLTRLIRREGWRDSGLGVGGRQAAPAILIAIVFPVVVGLGAYGTAWGLGLAEFAPAALPFAVPQLASPAGQFAVTVLLAATLITVLALPITPLGEELGWRGYMLPRLITARVPHPILTSGLIWGAWHLPLIMAGVYGPGGSTSPVLGIGLFMVTVVAMAYFTAVLRLSTGSIWPAMVAHSAWNAVMQAAFDPATSGPAAKLWTGESGVLVALATGLIVALISRTRWARRALHEPRL